MKENKNISMKEVKEKTGLTSRQIRYYDQMDLIFPGRSEGNQRLFSEEDITRLKKIKELLTKGYNVATIKRKLSVPEVVNPGEKSVYNNIDKIGKLNSLYPVSDRLSLVKMLAKNKEEKN